MTIDKYQELCKWIDTGVIIDLIEQTLLTEFEIKASEEHIKQVWLDVLEAELKEAIISSIKYKLSENL